MSLGRRLDILAQINPGAVPPQFLVAEEQADGSIAPAFRKKPPANKIAPIIIIAGVAVAGVLAAKYFDKRF